MLEYKEKKDANGNRLFTCFNNCGWWEQTEVWDGELLATRVTKHALVL